MKFRARLLLSSALLAVLPLMLLAFGIRREVTNRLTGQYAASVAALQDVVEQDLASQSRALADRLSSLEATMVDDNRLRLAVLGDSTSERRYLLDLAPRALALAGLDVLLIEDESGRILSSGHFRNEYGRMDDRLAPMLARSSDTLAVAELRIATGSLLALVRSRDVSVGLRRLTLIGGFAVDERFLARLQRDADLSVSLTWPGGSLAASAGGALAASTGGGNPGGDSTPAGPVRVRRGSILARDVALPFAPAPDASLPGRVSADSARFVIAQSLAPLVALRRRIDLWFLAATSAAVALALTLALWLSVRLSKPLHELANRTDRLDLDRLDVDFSTERTDEIGTLSRTLGALATRLRSSVSRLREAERRAAVGEIARQVNHDVRNGLTPIRNVVGHLAELARDNPTELPAVFLERKSTLDASIGYLHSLASNYARLSPRLERRPCDVNETVREVIRGVPEHEYVRVRTELVPALPAVTADPVALRRILENLVINAIESLPPGSGTVLVSTRAAANRGEARVHVVVADTGKGMTTEQLERVFEDFYTTKERGTGLGLSIVRRLVADLGGTVRVESGPARGTTFQVELPAAVDARAPARTPASSAPR